MGEITSFTAERIQAIEDASIVGGHIEGDNLILERHDETEVDAGIVRGPEGPGGNVPVGGIFPFAGSASPDALFLLCDGAAISRSTYSILFALIGTTYGVGDGSTTFNVPDLRGRAPIGVGDGPITSPRTLASIGGTETHLLTTAEMPAHTHVQNAHSHTSDYTGVTGYSNVAAGGGPVVGDITNIANNTGNTAATNQNTGGGGAHNNMQPWIALNYLIRAL